LIFLYNVEISFHQAFAIAAQELVCYI